MATDVKILNMALGHLGSDALVSVMTERSKEARAGNLFMATAKEVVLSDMPWPFATKTAALSLVEQYPTTEWGYSYRYPSDCLFIRKMLSGIRDDTRQSKVPYRFAHDDQGQLVYTDMFQAVIEYTVRSPSASLFSAHYDLALSFYLAHLMSPKITGGDKTKLGERALKLYVYEFEKAKAKALNEEQQSEEVDSEFIRARD